MGQYPSISAVVATFNRRGHLSDFIESLLADDALTEVVVVVDGSDDGSMELAEDYRSRDNRVSPLWVDHCGQFGALDAGVHNAGGEVVLLLDDDVIASRELCRRHAEHHERGDRLVVLGHMPPELPAGADASWFATRLYAVEYKKRCDAYRADSGEVLLHLWGGNVSLRRSDYVSLGYSPLEPPPGSPALRMDNQDRDFGLQCRAAGMTGVFDPKLSAVHRHRRPVEGFLRDAFGQGACEALLHAVHRDILGPFDLERYSADLPPPLRRLVEAAGVDSPAGERAETFASRTISAAVRAHSNRGAVLAAKLARRIQQRRGAKVMLRLLERSPDDQHSVRVASGRR